MNKNYLEIDLSRSNKETDGENLMKIQLKSGNTFQFNISRFFFRSKFVFDKYSEIMKLIEKEIVEIENKFEIKEEIIKEFFEIIHEDKVFVPIEHYKDIYTLSKHFCIPKLTNLLDNMMEDLIDKNLNFSIQILLDETEKENINKKETKIARKIEKKLSSRVNECLNNEKFKEVPIQTIYRIIDSAMSNDRKKVDVNILLDFILESAENRVILFRFVEFQRLRKDKLDKFIKFIDDQEENSQQIYLKYIPFNFLFFKQMKNENEELLNTIKENQEESKQIQKELKQNKEELKETKKELKQNIEELKQSQKELQQTKEELKQTKEELKQTKEELKQTKDDSKQTQKELQQTKEELKQTKDDSKQAQKELQQTKEELKQTKEELKQTKEQVKQNIEELKQVKNESKQTKGELKRIKNEFYQKKSDTRQYANTIMVSGYDKYNQLGAKPNKNNSYINPILKSTIDPSSLLSFSTYSNHSVQVTKSGKLLGIGDNSDGRISDSLSKTEITEFTEFSIRDVNGRQLDPISAVCIECGTLYMFSSESKRNLVLCDKEINGGHPVFLDIGDEYPVSLFGGYYHSAAITNKSEVIFINRSSVQKSPKSKIKTVCLPDGEKAVSVACCYDSVVALSSNGRVFLSAVLYESSVLNFSNVSELSDQEIIWVSGTSKHFLAVNKEGRVFGRGSNSYGELGLEKQTSETSSFKEISSLSDYKITAAYAGVYHSLFETFEGKILASGLNNCGQLLLNSDTNENVYSPIETMINESSSFCIVGNALSAVFIEGDPPPNTPNRLIENE